MAGGAVSFDRPVKKAVMVSTGCSERKKTRYDDRIPSHKRNTHDRALAEKGSIVAIWMMKPAVRRSATKQNRTMTSGVSFHDVANHRSIARKKESPARM